MLGIIIYIYFLLLGFLYADMLFKDAEFLKKLWLGAITGNLLLMAGIVPFAFIFGFSYISHILLIIAAAVPLAVISIKRADLRILKTVKGKRILDLNTDIKNGIMNNKIFITLVLPIALLICILMFNHILMVKGGEYYTGQCTYGDLQMHMDIISSLAAQHKFPPEYNILYGSKLCYPFFIDMLSASLCLFGTSIRWAILVPSFLFAFMIVMGFYYLAYTLTEKKSVAVLATVFFFINGAFGFAYFFEGAKSDPAAFTQIFTGYYKTPTNLNDMNIRWANTICDMIIPQRTTMAGWTYVICALWLLAEAVRENKRSMFIMLGVLAGCMPMIHTHSFMALGLISAVLAAFALYRAKDKKTEFKNWLYFGSIAAILALPQLFVWTFNQAGSEGFTQFHFNWVNEADPYIWFWIKNWGLVFLLAIPAFFNTSRRNKELILGGLLVFVTAELIQFQPLAYDNNKLFFVAYMIAVIVMCEFLFVVYDKLKDVKLRQYLAVLLIITCTLSGALTIGREWKSGGDYRIYSKDDIEFADFVKKNTDADKLFVTGTYHLNPVTALAGRSVYVGASLFLNFHGFRNELVQRESEVNSFYAASTPEAVRAFVDKNNIAYIVIGPQETDSTQININAFDSAAYEKIYDKGGYVLYATDK